MTVDSYVKAAGLMSGANLRQILRALRGDIRGFDPPDEPDPALIEYVNRPFESVAEVFARLSGLEERLREQNDRRAVFLTIYSRMTREVHEGLENGRFQETDWMRRYLITFANYYRRAFLAFERGYLGAVPDPWRIAFGTAVRGDALVVQDAFLGVNAHINYDLALSINDVGIDPNRAQKYADHRAINDILAQIVDAQQEALAEIYASGVTDIDALFGRLDESFSLLSMTEGREQAWRIAIVLTDVGLPVVASYARWVLRTTATGSAFLILGPRLDPSLMRVLREIETDTLDLKTILEHVEDHMSEGTRLV